MSAALLAAGGSMFGAAFVSQLLAFAGIAFLVWKFGVPLIGKMLGARTKEIEDRFGTLEREAKAAADRVADLKLKLSEIGSESARRLQAAVDEGHRIRSQSLAEAAGLAAQEAEKARRTVQIERDKAVLELRAEVARLTLEVAERAVDVLATDPVHGRIVEKNLEGLERASRK